MPELVVRQMTREDLAEVVALQPLAFPPPFPAEYHWDEESLMGPVGVFPGGQYVAIMDGLIVGSCCNTMISESQWAKHASWWETVGGVMLQAFDPNGSSLYGLDIAVHPDHRRRGIAKAFYERRFRYVRENGLARYGTACRVPDYRSYETAHPGTSVEDYVIRVVSGETTDRTLTPLLRMGQRFVGVVHGYMQDYESADCGALLEWRP